MNMYLRNELLYSFYALVCVAVIYDIRGIYGVIMTRFARMGMENCAEGGGVS